MSKIEIQQDLKHQNTAWQIRKIGFIIIFILIILAAAGLFGSGFLSYAEKGSKDASWIGYQRFSRTGSPAGLKMNFFNPGDSLILVSINNSFLKYIKIDRIMPQPVDEIALAEVTQFTFKTQSPSRRILIKFNYTPEKPGLYQSEIKYGKSKFIFKQLIYP